jgi:hypothetical protein
MSRTRSTSGSCPGKAPTPKRDIAWTVAAFAEELDRMWAERINDWTHRVIVGDTEDHIIRGEN